MCNCKTTGTETVIETENPISGSFQSRECNESRRDNCGCLLPLRPVGIPFFHNGYYNDCFSCCDEPFN